MGVLWILASGRLLKEDAEQAMAEKKINLLIVDDEEQFLESMGKRLEIRGFNVIAVNRGEKAIEAARQQPIDVALVDLKMPGMDGEATLEALKHEHQWMEVVILTGHGSINSAVHLTKSGAYEYLQKPCELDQLLDVLTAAYKKHVMNKSQIAETRMNDILRMADKSSPLDILRRLRELDEKGA
jgi:DNA-binding NtrC family response regulator